MERVLPGRRSKYHHGGHLGSHNSATDSCPNSKLGPVIGTIRSYINPISKPSFRRDLGNLPSKRPSLPHCIPCSLFRPQTGQPYCHIDRGDLQRGFVAVDVGVDIPLRLSLIGLSNSYSSANGASQMAYLATGQLTMDLANLTALVERSIRRNCKRGPGSLVHSSFQRWLHAIGFVQHRRLRLPRYLEHPRRLQTVQAKLVSHQHRLP